MQVYLMRHGEPLRPTEWEGSDSTRPLSDRGISHLKKIAPLIKDKGLSLKKILCSPYERAKQTATLISNLLGLEPVVATELASGVKPRDIRTFLLEHHPEGPLLLVGHMPDMPLFAASVVPDPKLLGEGLKPGEMWAVETGDMSQGWGTGKLLWRRSLEEWSHE